MAAATAVALSVSGCSRAPSSTPSPRPDPTFETPTATNGTTPPSSPPVDPTVVPDQITVEYLDAVMDEFDRMEAEVYRRVRAAGDATAPDAIERYVAFAESGFATDTLEGFAHWVGVDHIADPPRPPTTEVIEIIDQTETCVLFTAERSLAPLIDESVDYAPNQPYYIEMEQAEPNDLNPIPWRVTYDGWFVPESDVPDVCGEAGA